MGGTTHHMRQKKLLKSEEAYRTISEATDELNVPSHVLRFWEKKFSQIQPVKRAGGRRYYRPADLIILQNIRKLLYEDGYTIKGVQKLLAETPHTQRDLFTEGAEPIFEEKEQEFKSQIQNLLDRALALKTYIDDNTK